MIPRESARTGFEETTLLATGSVSNAARPTAWAGRTPFDLDDEMAYHSWRKHKLAVYPQHTEELCVEFGDIERPTRSELQRLCEIVARANMAIYVTRRPAGEDLSSLRKALSMFMSVLGFNWIEAHRSAASDGFVAIEVSEADGKRGFIPYTTRPLNWHTDGYYNPPQSPIRGMLLHCVRAASRGGENALLDPEIAYIRLRDTNPRWIAALMHSSAMTIPPSVEEDGSVRPQSAGPVFFVDPSDGGLVMRFTARGRNITWRDDADTRDAVAFLTNLLSERCEPRLLKVKLEPGQGLVCNNVLHTRTSFEDVDGSARLLLRARFRTPIKALTERTDYSRPLSSD
jgi:alpha-ketoglutarate-dependent taurine dioxygenase